MALAHSPKIVTNGLVLCLDAGNKKSYPGTGTTWNDLSGNNYHFNINASAFTTSNGVACMNFEGAAGAAKRVVGGVLTDVPSFSAATVMVFTSLLETTTNWRTLIRGAVNATGDHQVIVQSGGTALGMYDNGTDTFQSSGFNITSLPNAFTKFNCLTFRLGTSNPYYQFQFNNDSTVYSISNANATFNNGFAAIGCYHNASTDVNSSSQFWGKIATFIYYNRHLTQSEIQQNFNALRGRFGL